MIKSTIHNVRDGIMFHFSGIDYRNHTNNMRNNLTDVRENKQKKLMYVCAIASLLWGGLIVSYGIGLVSYYPAHIVPLFLPLSLAVICIFPMAMIWSAYVIYQHILHAQETGSAVLEAARILGSPALIAASDVETLSSAVAGELNKLRQGLRDIEDQMQNMNKILIAERESLAQTGEHLEKSLEQVTGKIYRERDAMIDLMKIVKNEKHSEALLQPQHFISDVSMIEDFPRIVTSPVLSESEQVASVEAAENFILAHERGLYEGLYALSVDFNRLLNSNPPQDLWPRYMRGERAVFADYLCYWIEENYADYRSAIGREDFRKISNRFIAQFETLKEHLSQLNKMSVFEYLLQSPIGKIYQLLSAEYV